MYPALESSLPKSTRQAGSVPDDLLLCNVLHAESHLQTQPKLVKGPRQRPLYSGTASEQVGGESSALGDDRLSKGRF